jgi:Na+/proline symporter
MVGGIKATFLTDYFNSLTILIIIFVFAFTVYTSDPVLGSPGRVYDILAELAKTRPLEGNAGGSYLTMKSKDGGIFFVINIIGTVQSS